MELSEMPGADDEGATAAIVEALRAARRSASPSGPVFWPGLAAEQAAEQRNGLVRWVRDLRARYPHALRRLPLCWPRHNDLVEALSALRDAERACFGHGVSLDAPIVWQRAFADIEARTDLWCRSMRCEQGRHVDDDVTTDQQDEAWDQFVAADVERRRRESS